MDKSSSSNMQAGSASSIFSSNSLMKYCSTSLANLQKLMLPSNYIDEKVLHGHRTDNLATDIEGAVLKLTKSWNLYSDHFPDRIRNIDATFERLLRLTAKAVFHGKFTKTVSPLTKSKLKTSVESCGFKMENQSLLQVCITFTQIIDEPWTKFVSRHHSSITCEEMEKIWNQEGWILLEERLEILLFQKMNDHAAIILEVCIMKGRQWHHLCCGDLDDPSEPFNPFQCPFEKFVQFMIIYVFLWNRNPNKYKAFDMWTSQMFQEVIKALLSDEDESKESFRLFPKLKDWKKAKKIALPFLETAVWYLLKCEGSSLDTLEALINLWIVNVPVNEEDDATEIPVVTSILNRINEVSSSAYIYLLGDMVQKNKVGLKDEIVKAKFVEIYVRAMSIDMERIEVQKAMKEVDKEKIVELQKGLSKNFVKIADVFECHPATSFQFLLTAHCLHPQDSLYQRLFPESQQHPEMEEKESSIPKCIDSPEILQLPPTLCEDLTTVINNPRWKAICRWTSREELKQLCRELVNTGGDLLIKEKELEFVNIDYDKFKNLKPAVDPDDDGIEKGYGYGEKRKPRKVITVTSLVPKLKPGRKRIETNLDGLENKTVKVKTVKRTFIRKIGNSLTRTLKKTKDAHSKYLVPSLSSKNLRTKLIANKYNNIYNRRRLLAYKEININNNFRRPLPKRIPKKSQAPRFLPSGYERKDEVVSFNVSDPSNPVRVTRSQTRAYSSKFSICIAERRSEDQINVTPDNPPDFKIFDKLFTIDETCKLSSHRCKETVNSEMSHDKVTLRSSHLPPLQNEDVMDAENNWRKKVSAKNLRRKNCHPKVILDPEPLINVELVKLARESMELMSVIYRFGLFPETNTPNPTSLNAAECNLQNGLNKTESVKNTQYYRSAPKSVKQKEQIRIKREMLKDCQERLSYFVESKRRALHSLIQLPEVPAFTNPDPQCSSQLVEENILQDLQKPLVTSFEHPQLLPPLSNVDGIQVNYVTSQLENNSEMSVPESTLDASIPIPLPSFNPDFQTVCDTSINYAQSICQTSRIQPSLTNSNNLNANPHIEFPLPYPCNPNFKSDIPNEKFSPEKVQYNNFANSQVPCNDYVLNKQPAYEHGHFEPDFSAADSGYVLNHENGMFCREESVTDYIEKGDISLQIPECGSQKYEDKSDFCTSSQLCKSDICTNGQLCPEHIAQTVSSMVSNPDFTPSSNAFNFNMPPKHENLDLAKPFNHSNTILTVPTPRRKGRKRPTEESVMATIASVVESSGFISGCEEAGVATPLKSLDDLQKSYQNGFPSNFSKIHNGEYHPEIKSNMLENSLCDSDYLPSKMKQSVPTITSMTDHNNEKDYLSTAIDLSTNDHPVGDVEKQLQEIIASVPALKEPFHLPQKSIPEMPSEAFSRQEGILPGLSRDILNSDPSDISAMEPTIKLKGVSTNNLQHSDAGTYCNLQVDEEENKQEIPSAPIYTDTAAVAALCDIPKNIEKANFNLPSRKIRKQPELTQIQKLLLLCSKEIRVQILPCDSPIQKNPFLVPRPILQMRNEDAYSANEVDDVVIIREVNGKDSKTRELTKRKPSSITSNEVSKMPRRDSMEKSEASENDDEIQVLAHVPKKNPPIKTTKRRTDNGRSRNLHRIDLNRNRNRGGDRRGVTKILETNLRVNGINNMDGHESEVEQMDSKKKVELKKDLEIEALKKSKSIEISENEFEKGDFQKTEDELKTNHENVEASRTISENEDNLEIILVDENEVETNLVNKDKLETNDAGQVTIVGNELKSGIIKKNEDEQETVRENKGDQDNILENNVKPETILENENLSEIILENEVEPETVLENEDELGAIDKNVVEPRCSLKTENELGTMFQNKEELGTVFENKNEQGIILDNDKPETIVKNDESETILENDKPNATIENEDELEIILANVVEPTTVVENAEPETMFENDEPGTILENDEPESILRNDEPETILRNDEPETILRNDEPETILRNDESETILENDKPETIIDNDKPETILDNNESETILENDGPETILENDEPETILDNNEPETILDNDDPETIFDNDEPETILENDGPETILANEDQAETILENEDQAETILTNEDQAETILENEDQAETILENEDQAETILENEDQAETILENEDQAETILENEDQGETILENEDQGETILENEDQAETILENEDQAETILENEDQAETILENEVQEERFLENEDHEETFLDNEDQAETILENEDQADIILENVYPEIILKNEDELAAIDKNVIETRCSLKNEDELGNMLQNKEELGTMFENKNEQGIILESDEPMTIVKNDESKTIVINDESETIVKNDESETILENDKPNATIENEDELEIILANVVEPKTVVENAEPKTIFENDEPETFFRNDESETILRNDESEAILRNDESETILERDEPETILDNDEPETILERDEPETILDNDEPETLLDNDEPETILDNDELETILEKEEPETIVENDGPETILENEDQAKTILENEDQAETILENEDQAETILENEDQAETILENEVQEEIILENEDQADIVLENEDKADIPNAKNAVHLELIGKKKVEPVQIAEHELPQCAGSPIGNTATSTSFDRCTKIVRTPRKFNCRFLSSSQKLRNGSTTFASDSSKNDEQKQQLMKVLSTSLKLDVSSAPVTRSKRDRSSKIIKANERVHSTRKSISNEDALPTLKVECVPPKRSRSRLKASTDEDDSPPTLDLYLSK